MTSIVKINKKKMQKKKSVSSSEQQTSKIKEPQTRVVVPRSSIPPSNPPSTEELVSILDRLEANKIMVDTFRGRRESFYHLNVNGNIYGRDVRGVWEQVIE